MTTLSILATDAGVQPGLIDLAGWILGVGGLLLAALWLRYLTR